MSWYFVHSWKTHLWTYRPFLKGLVSLHSESEKLYVFWWISGGDKWHQKDFSSTLNFLSFCLVLISESYSVHFYSGSILRLLAFSSVTLQSIGPFVRFCAANRHMTPLVLPLTSQWPSEDTMVSLSSQNNQPYLNSGHSWEPPRPLTLPSAGSSQHCIRHK